MQVNRISIKEFREKGYLQELNRLFLHPLGLALEINIDTDGTEKLGGVWDYRDDDDGIRFIDDATEEQKKKVENIRKISKIKHEKRKKTLGYVIQEFEGK